MPQHEETEKIQSGTEKIQATDEHRFAQMKFQVTEIRWSLGFSNLHLHLQYLCPSVSICGKLFVFAFSVPL